MTIFIGVCAFIGYIFLMSILYGAMPDYERGALNYQKYYKALDESRITRKPFNLNKCYGN